MQTLTPDWVEFSLFAALLKLPSSQAATKHRICRISIEFTPNLNTAFAEEFLPNYLYHKAEWD
jgi:hypothetical protein